jgi:hypothetical protein
MRKIDFNKEEIQLKDIEMIKFNDLVFNVRKKLKVENLKYVEYSKKIDLKNFNL